MASGTDHQLIGSRLWGKVKGVVMQDIGEDWKGLARECDLNGTTIEGIAYNSPNSLLEQINEMFRNISMQHFYTSAYSLMQCLRVASTRCQMTPPKYRILAERVFNVIIEDVCSDQFYDKWEEVAEAAGFSTQMIQSTKDQHLKDLKKQGQLFLTEWVSRSKWDVLKELPLALKKVSNPSADQVVQDVFGMPSLEEFTRAQQALQAVPRPLSVGDAVTVTCRGIPCKGKLRWTGFMAELGQEIKMAGIELLCDYRCLKGLTCNGTSDGRRYFDCTEGLGLFADCTEVQPDQSAGQTLEQDHRSAVLNWIINDDPPTLSQLRIPMAARSLPPGGPSSQQPRMVRSTSSPGPSSRTTPQPSERTNVDNLRDLNIRAAVSVARWEKYTFVPDVVRVLADRNGLQKDSIEKVTVTRISFEGSPPTSSPDSSSSLQPVIVSIYGTEEQVKNALFLITAQVQDNTPEFIQSSMPPHMDQRCAEAGQLNIYDKAKRDIKHDIGSKWRGLARALNFSQTDIDAIEVESRDDLPSQIFKMIHKWEQRQEKGKGTVFGLLQGLRTAANDSGDEIFRRFRDRIFSDILEEYILMSPNVCEMWQRIAKYLKFSGSDIYSCTLKDTNNKRTQAQAFLHLWVERYGWKVVEDLPVTLEKAGFEKDAAKVQDEVFGECSHLPLQQTVTPVPQSQPVDPVLEVDHLVVVQWAGLTLRGTLKWMGSLPGQDNMAGVELDEKYAVLEGTDVLCSGEKGNVKYTYFNSPAGLGAFFSQHDVSRDKRFLPDVDGQPDQPSLFAPQHLQMLDEAPRLVTRSMSNPVGSSSSYSSSFSTPSSKPRPSQTSSNIHTLSTVRSQDESPSQQNNLFLAQPQQESPSLSYRENLVVSPVQETTCNLSSINLLGAQAELDSPFHQQRPPTAHNTPNPSSNTSQQTSPISSPQAVASSEDISSSPKSKDHSFQPLLEVGEQKVYGLSFGGDVAGLIIGSGGATVNRIQDISHAKVEVVRKKGSSITEDTTLLVAGKEEHCLKAIEMMVESVQRKTERLQRFTEIMPLPDEQAGRVIGKDGQTLKAIQDYSGATITIESRPVGIVGILASGCNRDCEIRGSRIEINKAKSQIQRVMSGDNLSELMVARFVCQVLRQIAAG